MLIVLDKNLAEAGGRHLFAAHAELAESTHITRAHLQAADALIVRTTTPVHASLVQDATRLTFVGTASAGADHVDTAYLRARAIRFAYAAGCNADAVADYVLAALTVVDRFDGLIQGRYSLGLVGFGHTGRRLAGRLNAVARVCGGQTRILVYDPFLTPAQIAKYHVRSAPLREILMADCISLHCPLTRGQHATLGMLDRDALSHLTRDQVLINTARGDILAPAWPTYCGEPRDDTGVRLIFDVWPTHTNDLLVRRCLLATPHIAGYGLAAKRQALASIYEAFCHHFHLHPTQKQSMLATSALPQPRATEGVMAYLKRLLLLNYDIERDSLNTKHQLALARSKTHEQESTLQLLTKLRRDYVLRPRLGGAARWRAPRLHRAAARAILSEA